MNSIFFKSILIFILLETPSYGYLGPGLGGGILAATVGVIVAILAAIFGLIWFPLKRFLKKRKENKTKEQKKID